MLKELGPCYPFRRIRLHSQLLASAWLSPGYFAQSENELANGIYLSIFLSVSVSWK